MKLIRVFVEHRLAANLGMVLMLLAGVWAITQITVQLNPSQPRPYVNTSIAWRGASAEDVENLVTTPLEQQLKTTPDVKSIWSVTRDTSSLVQVEVNRMRICKMPWIGSSRRWRKCAASHRKSSRRWCIRCASANWSPRS